MNLFILNGIGVVVLFLILLAYILAPTKGQKNSNMVFSNDPLYWTYIRGLELIRICSSMGFNRSNYFYGSFISIF